MNIEIVNESKNYKLTKNDLFIIEELCYKTFLGQYTSIVFKLNNKVHIDFIDFKEKKVYIYDTKTKF
jgi:hypothetical protein